MKPILPLILLLMLPFISFGEGRDTVIRFHHQIDPLNTFEKNKTGWEISGNFGVYKANKHHAQFYNGASENVNNLDYVFNNYYWRQEIIDQLVIHAQRDSFQISEIPADIQYDMSMYVGFSGRYHYSGELALNFSFNYAKLRTRDMLVLEVFPAYSGMVESFVYCGIYGIEARTNIDAGFLYTFRPEKQITGFAEMGLNLNSTHVKRNFLQIFDKEYNLINIYGSSSYIPNSQLNEYDVRQGGIGFGLYASPGIRYTMSDQFAMELAAITYLKTVNLEGYNEQFGLHGGLLFRLVLSPNFNFGSGEDTIEY
jgi:hypothetical protein